MKKSLMMKIAIGALVLLGISLLLLGAFWSMIVNNNMIAEAESYAVLKQENAKYWEKIPGAFNFSVIKNFYLYDCINPDDVWFYSLTPLGYFQWS